MGLPFRVPGDLLRVTRLGPSPKLWVSLNDRNPSSTPAALQIHPESHYPVEQPSAHQGAVSQEEEDG